MGDRHEKPKHDEARVLAPEAAPHRSRKNTRRWCRGKPGIEHHPELTIRQWGYLRGDPCHYWAVLGEWICYHVQRCTECGKILCHLGDECPDYTPRPT